MNKTSSHGVKSSRKHHDLADDYEEYDEIEYITITKKKKRRKSSLGIVRLGFCHNKFMIFFKQIFFQGHYDFDENTDFSEVDLPGLYAIYADQTVDVVHRTPKPAICTAWNGNKIKTFDGLTYK